jgi:hypothetical protein
MSERWKSGRVARPRRDRPQVMPSNNEDNAQVKRGRTRLMIRLMREGFR